MKSVASLLSIFALGFGLLGCAAKEEVPFTNTTAASAPFGVVGNDYSATLATTCSTVLLPWTVSSGVLPIGLSFNGATGDVTGRPIVAGNFIVVFAGKDSTGKTETCAVLFLVHPRTDRVSVDTNGNSVAGAVNTEPSISWTDGRFIAFTSTGSTLIPVVVGQQIYVHDRQTGRLSLVSMDSFGNAGTGGASSAASVSADGRFVAFVSTATNLVPGVSGQQIYLHDTQPLPNGRTTLVSQDGSGNPANAGLFGTSNTAPRVSANGRFIAFVSTATNLVPGVSGQQIYLHDTQTSVTLLNGQTTLVSQDGSGTPATPGSLNTSPTISADGRFIAFVSTATNLVSLPSGVSVSGQQIYLHDTQLLLNGRTTLVSKDGSGFPASTNGTSTGLSNVSNTAPTISADGRFIAFVSNAINLDPSVPAGSGQQIYRHDTQQADPNKRTTLVSKDNSIPPAPANAGLFGTFNTSPTISEDGRFIAFVSTATNLVSLPSGVSVSGQQIYLHDTQLLLNGQTTLVSKDESGTPATPGSSNLAPVVATNGAFVAFVSSATNLVTSPPPAAAVDVYVRALP